MADSGRGPIYIRKTRPRDLQEFWVMIEEQGPGILFPRNTPTSYEEMAILFEARSLASITCIDNNQVVGGAWLEQTQDEDRADIVMFKRKGYANPAMVRRICREALPSIFMDHNLTAITGRVMDSNKPMIRLFKALGFYVLHHHPTGVLTIGIGREEVLTNE